MTSSVSGPAGKTPASGRTGRTTLGPISAGAVAALRSVTTLSGTRCSVRPLGCVPAALLTLRRRGTTPGRMLPVVCRSTLNRAVLPGVRALRTLTRLPGILLTGGLLTRPLLTLTRLLTRLPVGTAGLRRPLRISRIRPVRTGITGRGLRPTTQHGRHLIIGRGARRPGEPTTHTREPRRQPPGGDRRRRNVFRPNPTRLTGTRVGRTLRRLPLWRLAL